MEPGARRIASFASQISKIPARWGQPCQMGTTWSTGDPQRFEVFTLVDVGVIPVEIEGTFFFAQRAEGWFSRSLDPV